jgi:hypothetical protein
MSIEAPKGWIPADLALRIRDRQEEEAELEKTRRLRYEKYGEDKPIDFRAGLISKGARQLLDKPLPKNPRGGKPLGGGGRRKAR